jgi:hypothetical protein
MHMGDVWDFLVHFLLFQRPPLWPGALVQLEKVNVPPSFRDGGAWEQGDAHGGRVGTSKFYGNVDGGCRGPCL